MYESKQSEFVPLPQVKIDWTHTFEVFSDIKSIYTILAIAYYL